MIVLGALKRWIKVLFEEDTPQRLIAGTADLRVKKWRLQNWSKSRAAKRSGPTAVK